MDPVQDVSFRCVKGMLANQIFQSLGVIDFNFPKAHVVVVSKAKVALESVTFQNASSQSLLYGGFVRVIEPPPRPNYFGRAIRVPIVKSCGEPTRVVNGLVECKWLRRLQPAHGAEQRRLARLVLADKACEVTDFELFAVLD